MHGSIPCLRHGTGDVVYPMRYVHHGWVVNVVYRLIYRHWQHSSPPGQNGRHFTDDNMICIFVNQKLSFLINISRKFVPKYPIDNNPALAYIMAWRRISDRPLSEPMLTRFIDPYMRLYGGWVNDSLWVLSLFALTVLLGCLSALRSLLSVILLSKHG